MYVVRHIRKSRTKIEAIFFLNKKIHLINKVRATLVHELSPSLSYLHKPVFINNLAFPDKEQIQVAFQVFRESDVLPSKLFQITQINDNRSAQCDVGINKMRSSFKSLYLVIKNKTVLALS